MIGKVVTDELIDQFNWSGKAGKKALSSYKIFSKVMLGKFIFFLLWEINLKNIKKNTMSCKSIQDVN